MRKPASVDRLTDLGRVRLSRSFFMRDFLHSEVASMHGIANIPDDPDLAIEAGSRLCETLLEPLQEHWGRLAIRSAYRSSELNAFANVAQRAGKKGYNCASNDANFARHIWDRRDADGHIGATACIVIPSFWDEHQATGDWQIMAQWIERHLPYSEMEFFPTYWAFNLSWHERPKRSVFSYAEPKGYWSEHGRI